MKKTFVKSQGRSLEKLIIENEEKWIHVQYFRGGLERTSYILKNSNKTDEQYLADFFTVNHVSEEMMEDVKKHLNVEKHVNREEWHGFVIFLLNAFSMHLVMGVAMGITIFTGYKLGARLDMQFDLYPTFTVFGVFAGLALGGLVCYSIFHKYIKQDKNKLKAKNETQEKDSANKQEESKKTWPIIEPDLEDIRNAVRTFSENLPKGVYRTILVKDDFSIDFEQLAHILGGIPAKKYYMSRETYDIFEEQEKDVPGVLDKVQKAVDAYVKDNKKYPMLQYDPLRRVNYYELLQEHYLDSKPELETYITDYDGLITHIKPKKKGTV